MFGGNYWTNPGMEFHGNVQPMVPQQQSSSFIQVHNRQSVEQFYVAPGNEALFMYEDEAVIARKRVDIAGVSVIEEYDLVPRVQKAEPAYVTREEFEAFVRKVTNESTYHTPTSTTEYDATAASNAATGYNSEHSSTANDASSQL